MGAPAKFLFDTDFAAPDKTREKPATAAEIALSIPPESPRITLGNRFLFT